MRVGKGGVRRWAKPVQRRVGESAPKGCRRSGCWRGVRGSGPRWGGSYPRQEEWETDYEFVPRIDGIPTGDTANVRPYRVNFQFGEILPLYPAPA